MCEMIDREGCLETVCCALLEVRELRPGVEHKRIDTRPVKLVENRMGKSSHVRQSSEI